MALTNGDTFRVERSTTIDAPADVIFTSLNEVSGRDFEHGLQRLKAASER
jgi:hypothetical protein